MDTKLIRKELLALLLGGNAHMDFDFAVSDFPMTDINKKIPNASYTVWRLLEHMRIAQWDILDFIRDKGHVSPDFPDGYWPPEGEKATPAKWKKTVQGFKADLKALAALARSPKTDLLSPIPHAEGYTVFREILLAADHNAFHIGELAALRRALDMKPVKEY